MNAAYTMAAVLVSDLVDVLLHHAFLVFSGGRGFKTPLFLTPNLTCFFGKKTKCKKHLKD